MALKINLDNNIEDYSDWVVGGATTNGFQPWAAVQTNISRVSGSDPFGATNVLWDVIGTGSNPTFYVASGYTYGGMTGKLHQPVDQTKTYRYSLWVNRVSSGDTAAISGERFYYGLYNYNQSYTNTGATSITNGGYGTNLYFIYQTPVLSTTYPINTWQLLVAHMFPYTWTGTTNHPNSGIWRNGVNIGGLNGDVKFNFNTYYTSMRCYAPYVGGRYCHYQLAYPRLDCVDGTEPSIETLLTNEGPWREMSAMKINIGDVWKSVIGGWINIGDSWKKFHSVISPLSVSLLIVGGGGGGGTLWNDYGSLPGTTRRWAGGGGAGGTIVSTGTTISENQIIVVGGGGGAQTNGTASSFGVIIGSGGNGASNNATGASGNGYSGGSPAIVNNAPYQLWWGGGGAGGATKGGNSTTTTSGAGGTGRQFTISGANVYYAGGGRGGRPSTGSLGIDGNGPIGKGGVGGSYDATGGGSGAAGIVIIRYTSATQRATGGTVTTSGGDYIHTFTSSGTFTLT